MLLIGLRSGSASENGFPKGLVAVIMAAVWILPCSTVQLISLPFSLNVQLDISQSHQSRQGSSQRNFGAQRLTHTALGSEARMVSPMLAGKNYWKRAVVSPWVTVRIMGSKRTCQFWTTTVGLCLIFVAQRNSVLDLYLCTVKVF